MSDTFQPDLDFDDLRETLSEIQKDKIRLTANLRSEIASTIFAVDCVHISPIL